MKHTPTGTVFSKRHKEYFKEPRLMDNIANELFGGDFWEAHHFQNDALNTGLLKIVTIDINLGEFKVNKIHLVNSNWEPKG